MKRCPKCGQNYPDSKSLCIECGGIRLEEHGMPVSAAGCQPSPNKAARDNAVPDALETMLAASRASGMKKVADADLDRSTVSLENSAHLGDINCQKQTVEHMTVNIQKDETKETLQCIVCRKIKTKTDGLYQCSRCNNFACGDHFHKDSRMCDDCDKALLAERKKQYREHLITVLSDGVRTVQESEFLRIKQKELGITDVIADEIEKEVIGNDTLDDKDLSAIIS